MASFKGNAAVVRPINGSKTEFDVIRRYWPVSPVLPERRERDQYGQKMFVVYADPSFRELTNEHHLIINDRRYAVQDVQPMPDDAPVVIIVTLAYAQD